MAASSSTKPLHFLITGAGRGIGRGLSRLLTLKGHRVFLVDSNADELFHTCDLIAKSLPYPTQPPFRPSTSASSTPITPASEKHSGGSSTAPLDALQCNLRHRSDIEQAARAASAFFDGHLDVLINNAAYTGGVGGPSITASYTFNGHDGHGHSDDAFADSWAASVETNLTAPVILSRACLPMLRKDPPHRAQGGSIIHISSTRAWQSEADSEGYATTKAGLIGLTHSMAVSLAKEGVRVNAVLPGWINVANECKEADEKGTKWEDGLTAEDHAWHLTGKVGSVEDILAAVEYLATSGFITGTETVVDGGVTRKMVYPE